MARLIYFTAEDDRGMYIEFTVSSPSVFQNPHFVTYRGAGYAPGKGHWQQPGEPGEGGDPLKGALHIFLDNGVPRSRFRRDRGPWMENDLSDVLNASGVREDFVRSWWRTVQFMPLPNTTPPIYGVNSAGQLAFDDSPPFTAVTVDSWTVDNFFLYPEPQEPGYSFWTKLRNCREFEDKAPEQAATPPIAIPVSVPASITLDSIEEDEHLWFMVESSGATYRFHTTNSPDPYGHDTLIAVFRKDGVLVAWSDDISLDPESEDYRSSVTSQLPPGTYYIGVSGYGETGPQRGFKMPASSSVIAGAVLEVELV